MSYKRVVISEYGPPSVLTVVEAPDLPEPGPGDVRVRVLAVTASFTDTIIRKGRYPGVKEQPPFAPGYDMVGVVDKAGPGVTEVAVGQTVAELTVTGGYAEYLCLPADRLVPVPDGLDPAEAVSLILSYVTAYQMLHRVVKVERGQRLLAHGAGGAVGTAVLELGKLQSLEMYGTASLPKHDLVSSLGATPIDYRNEDFVERIHQLTGDGVDAVLDPIGGDHFKRSFRSLRPGGTLVAYGFYDAAMGRGRGSVMLDFARVFLWGLLPNGRSTATYSIAPWRKRHADWFAEDLGKLFDLLDQGKIRPVIAERMPLAAASRAHALIEEAAVEGRIVLTVG